MYIRHYHSSWCVNFEWINLTSYDNYHPKAQTVGKVVRSRVSGVPQTWCSAGGGRRGYMHGFSHSLTRMLVERLHGPE